MPSLLPEELLELELWGALCPPAPGPLVASDSRPSPRLSLLPGPLSELEEPEEEEPELEELEPEELEPEEPEVFGLLLTSVALTLLPPV